MSSPKSPYKEVGLSSLEMSSQPKRRRRPKGEKKLYSYDPGKIPRTHHDFSPLDPTALGRQGRQVVRADAATCRRCGQPRFAVDGQRCRGRRR